MIFKQENDAKQQHVTPSIHVLQFAERQWLPEPHASFFWWMILCHVNHRLKKLKNICLFQPTTFMARFKIEMDKQVEKMKLKKIFQDL